MDMGSVHILVGMVVVAKGQEMDVERVWSSKCVLCPTRTEVRRFLDRGLSPFQPRTSS